MDANLQEKLDELAAARYNWEQTNRTYQLGLAARCQLDYAERQLREAIGALDAVLDQPAINRRNGRGR